MADFIPRTGVAEHLSHSDPLWTRIPRDWDQGPILGNGRMGATFYAPEGRGFLFKPGHTDLYDNRPLEKYTIMDKQFNQPRLQLGELELVTKAPVVSFHGRLSLYDAVFTAEVVTEAGKVSVRALIPRDADAIVADISATEGEEAFLSYIPFPAESPRQTKMREFRDWNRYRQGHPEPRPLMPVEKKGDTEIFEQPLYCGGSYTVCLAHVNPTRWIYTVAAGERDGESRPAALAVAEGLREDRKAMEAHFAFWHGLYERSFLTLSDAVWENYYWNQIYKMACAARPGGRIIDTMGPWCTTTSWPSAFWNLNVQLTYAPMIPTGLFDVCRSLPDTLWANREDLRQNIDPRFRADSYGIGTNTCRSLRSEVMVPTDPKTDKVELGNLTWALFVSYTLCRTTVDEEMLTGEVLPLLEGCVNYYLHFLSPDEKGVLHLAPTESPEYLVVDEDTNYDLALLRWGLTTLIAEHTRLGDKKDLISRWQEVLDHLTPYPEDPQEGLLIAGHTHLTMSHRHYSHLLAFYPLHLLDAKKEEDCARIRRSVAHWHSMPEQLEGYSQTGAASMLAMMGDGEGAIKYLNALLWEFIRPNTLYREEGGPVIETPLAAVSSLVDMLFQSYGGELNVFPACPEKWKDAAFRLYGENGFAVSAARRDGKLQFVTVESSVGAPCVLYAQFEKEPVCDVPFTYDGKKYTLDIPAGGRGTLRVCPEEEVCLRAVTHETNNIFGKNDRTLEVLQEEPHHVRVWRKKGKIL